MWSSGGDASRRPREIKVRDLDAERSPPPPLAVDAASPGVGTPPLSMGWLLRLFRSDFFDAWMAVTYLYRYRASRGVHDYLCNELYHLSDADLEAFLPQVCNLLVHHAKDSPALERFVMDKCASSLHFAVQVYWFLQAAVEDAVRDANKEAEARCRMLRTRCETATVNGVQRTNTEPPASAAEAAAAAAAALAESEAKAAAESAIPLSREQPKMFTSSSAGYIPTVSIAELIPSSSQPLPHPPSGSAVRLPIPGHRRAPSTPVGALLRIDGLNSVGPSKLVTNGLTPNSAMSFDDMAKAANAIAVDLPAPSTASEDDDEDTNDEPRANSSSPDADPDTDVNGNGTARSLCAALEASRLSSGDDGSGLVVDVDSEGDADSYGSASGSSRSCVDAKKADEDDLLVEIDPPSPEPPSPSSSATSSSSISPFDHMTLLTMKQERFDYFNDSLAIAKAFVRVSLAMRDLPSDDRAVYLQTALEDINDLLLRRMAGQSTSVHGGGVDGPPPDPEAVAALGQVAALRSIHLPLSRAMTPALRILRVVTNDAIILTSKARVPYMLYVEVLPTEMNCRDPLLFCHNYVHSLRRRRRSHTRGIDANDTPAENHASSAIPANEEDSNEFPALATPIAGSALLPMPRKMGSRGSGPPSAGTPAQRQRANVVQAVYGAPHVQPVAPFSDLDLFASDDAAEHRSTSISSLSVARNGMEDEDRKSREAALLAVYGELWSWKEERILKASPFRNLKGSRLMPFIVKGGDDLRQEQLAIQLISQFDWIFKEESVDVYLRPFTVMSVSSEAGFVEVIPDSMSIHTLKKRTPNFVSLLDYFERAYGQIGSRSFRQAQRRFIRSMAGYSLVSYFLQIKDRHNGNIMLDAQGHIVHIDFGFMLTNSPGAIKFESVPFKLTEEYLQVVCARKNVQDAAETSKTEGYRYFQELFVLGLLAARKHYEKLTTLVEIMMEGTSMPCMSTGHSVVESLRHRFSLGVSEEATIATALALIEESRLSWRSAGYDKFSSIHAGVL
jgi:Phosphatidylinositol 3- and 4-kinase